MEELDWPAQSPDLNPIEHLWDELELWLQAKPNCSTSVPKLTNALVAEWKQVPGAMFQHLVESLSRRVEAVIAAKGGPTPFNAHDFGMRYLTRCPHTSGHVVYQRGVESLAWASCPTKGPFMWPDEREGPLRRVCLCVLGLKGSGSWRGYLSIPTLPCSIIVPLAHTLKGPLR